ncbi:MAG TPA: hypothetical protein VLC09_11525 [Polyangiaceae bacterium]|nr:hypothetical protein [Polyangiaceae bacterium]
MKSRTVVSSWIACSLLASLAAVGCVAKTGDSDGADGTGTDTGGDLDGDGVVDGGDFGDDASDPGVPDDSRDLPIRDPVCDAQGVCTCLRLALLGTLESAATDTDTQPFVDWLNGKSDGTATVTMVSTKPTLDAAWLANYDILVVANVNSWTFTDAEKAAVQTWSQEQGGGIITLTGFTSVAAEPAASSALIGFSGISYTGTGEADWAANQGAATPVYYQGGTTDLKQCLSWSGAYVAKDTTAVPFVAQTGTLEKLTANLAYVGAYIGWGIAAPADATVVATDPKSGKPIAVAKEVNAKGRVFSFGDEWIIFANQWAPSGTPSNTQQDQYNPCWMGEPNKFHSVATLYQTKQLWYNAIKWVAPPNRCDFKVADPEVVN